MNFTLPAGCLGGRMAKLVAAAGVFGQGRLVLRPLTRATWMAPLGSAVAPTLAGAVAARFPPVRRANFSDLPVLPPLIAWLSARCAVRWCLRRSP